MTVAVAVPRKVSRQTLHSEITSQLRDLIVLGHFRPGEKINEVRLGADLGVSRTPLREAIRTLGSEGLLDLVPNRGAIVRSFSLDDVLDMMEALGVMEQGCAVLTCERATNAEFLLFNERHHALLETYRARDRLRYFQINQDLHAMIVALPVTRHARRSTPTFRQSSSESGSLETMSPRSGRARWRNTTRSTKPWGAAIVTRLSRCCGLTRS
jgi:DNA-binding GntR family transcriptional regulator